MVWHDGIGSGRGGCSSPSAATPVQWQEYNARSSFCFLRAVLFLLFADNTDLLVRCRHAQAAFLSVLLFALVFYIMFFAFSAPYWLLLFADNTDLLMRCTHVLAAFWSVLPFALLFSILPFAHVFGTMLCLPTLNPQACCAVTHTHCQPSALLPNTQHSCTAMHKCPASPPASTSMLCSHPHTLPAISALAKHTTQLHSHAQVPC